MRVGDWGLYTRVKEFWALMRLFASMSASFRLSRSLRSPEPT